MLVNMSVWQDADSLRKFVYRSAHAEILRRRREWFEKMSEAIFVLWWVPRGHRPSLVEAIARLELLRRKGPHPEAFTFRETYPPPDAPAIEQPGGFEELRGALPGAPAQPQIGDLPGRAVHPFPSDA